MADTKRSSCSYSSSISHVVHMPMNVAVVALGLCFELPGNAPLEHGAIRKVVDVPAAVLFFLVSLYP